MNSFLPYEIDTEILNQLPYCVCWKNMDSEFMGGNQAFLNACGYKTVDSLNGKSDFDMPWCDSHAEKYRTDDNEVLLGKSKLNYIETQLQASGKVVTVLVNKTPRYDSAGKIIGLICGYNTIFSNQLVENLPTQQYKCLMYTMQGLSAKQIAKKLQLTSRTVEYYLGLIKKKLGARNKFEFLKFLFEQVSSCYFNK